MNDTVIRVENLSKQYRLGVIGSNTLRDDVARLVARLRGKPDPTLKIGQSSQSPIPNPQSPDTIWALKDVSFEVKQGEVVGIIGRNGAGKSTLLKILSRITAPTSGHVKVKGRIASLLEVGTGFHPELTGRENIYLNGAILGMKRAEIARKFDEIVDFSGVEQFIDTPVKRYSSGMYVRLAFAVAAHLEPEILLVDEVLAVGDAEFQKKCLGKMGEVAKEGRTVLFVSHNLGAIKTLTPISILLVHGNLSIHGPTTDVIGHYLQAFSQFGRESVVSLTDHPNRPAGYRCWMQTLWLQTPNNDTSMFIGESITVLVQFQAEQLLQPPVFSYAISSITGEAILGNSVRVEGLQGEHQSIQYGVIAAHLDNLPLMPGKYSISLWFGNNRHDFDYIPYATSFTVMANKIAGKTALPDPTSGPIYWPARFELKNSTFFNEHRRV